MNENTIQPKWVSNGAGESEGGKESWLKVVSTSTLSKQRRKSEKKLCIKKIVKNMINLDGNDIMVLERPHLQMNNHTRIIHARNTHL